jgi:hypothetical protein
VVNRKLGRRKRKIASLSLLTREPSRNVQSWEDTKDVRVLVGTA